jgi:hypothetical protein
MDCHKHSRRGFTELQFDPLALAGVGMTYYEEVSTFGHNTQETLDLTYQKRPPARASKAAPPTAIPTIAPVDKTVPPLLSELLDSVASLAAAVVVELDVDSELVAVFVAVCARLSNEVFASAGSG